MRIIEGFKLRNIMGEFVIVAEGVAQVNFNKLVVINASASYLWQSVENKDFTPDELVILLVDKYGISTDRAIADVASIVDEWIQNGLIR